MQKAYHHETDPKTETESGIWDTMDKCWMGDAQGPMIYEDYDLARLGATLLNKRTQHSTRYRARPYERGKKIHGGEVTPRLSLREAITQIERHDDGSWDK